MSPNAVRFIVVERAYSLLPRWCAYAYSEAGDVVGSVAGRSESACVALAHQTWPMAVAGRIGAPSAIGAAWRTV